MRRRASKVERARTANLRLFFLFIDHYPNFFGAPPLVFRGIALVSSIRSISGTLFGDLEKPLSRASDHGERIGVPVTIGFFGFFGFFGFIRISIFSVVDIVDFEKRSRRCLFEGLFFGGVFFDYLEE